MLTPLKRPQYLFVYGTLRSDDHTTTSRYRTDFNSTVTKTLFGEVKGRLYFDKYPCLVPEEEGIVTGLLVTSHDFPGLLAKGDKIEGVASGFYRREEIDASLEDGTVVRAFVYVRRDCDRSVMVDGGDWVKRDRLAMARREVLDALPTASIDDVNELLTTYAFNSRIVISMLRWKCKP